MKRLLILAVGAVTAVLVFVVLSASASRQSGTTVHVIEHAVSDATTDRARRATRRATS